MQVFKFFILLLILIASSIIGLLISKKYSNRVQELRELKNALNMLETKIKFTYEPLPEIFKQISQNVSQNISEIFVKANEQIKVTTVKEAWDFAIKNTMLDINDEDKGIIKNLGNLLRKNRC